MILVDTSGAYALLNRSDINHARASELFRARSARDVFAISTPVITEACCLLSARIDEAAANRLLKAVADRVFHLLALDRADVEMALEINEHYKDSRFGFVDSSCFVLCERHRIEEVLTFDHRDFHIYRPQFCRHLRLLP